MNIITPMLKEEIKVALRRWAGCPSAVAVEAPPSHGFWNLFGLSDDNPNIPVATECIVDEYAAILEETPVALVAGFVLLLLSALCAVAFRCKAKEEAERLAREEAERKAKKEAERLAREEAKTRKLRIEDLRVGVKYVGEVTNAVDFGCFINFGCEKQGLMYYAHPQSKSLKPKNMFEVKRGQKMKVRVNKVDYHRRRITLGFVDYV